MVSTMHHHHQVVEMEAMMNGGSIFNVEGYKAKVEAFVGGDASAVDRVMRFFVTVKEDMELC